MLIYVTLEGSDFLIGVLSTTVRLMISSEESDTEISLIVSESDEESEEDSITFFAF